MKQLASLLLISILIAACQGAARTPAQTQALPTLPPTSTRLENTPALRHPTSTLPVIPTLTESPTPSPINTNSFAAGLSADGRFLAFTSWDDHLVKDDTNGMPDAFVFDRATGTIERVSVTSSGEQLVGWTGAVSISADGRYVLFSSDFRTGAQMANYTYDGLYVHDRQTGHTELIRLDQANDAPRHYHSMSGKISADGRFVAVEGIADHSPGDRGDSRLDEWNVYLVDRQTGQVKKLSQAPDGSPADESSSTVAMTPDGRWIAFLSRASNLTPGDQLCADPLPLYRCADIFVYDRTTQKLERIPVGYGMGMGGPGDRLSISGDGRWIAYNNLTEQDNPAQFQVNLYDRQTRQRIVVCTSGWDTPCSGHTPALSMDGRRLAFAINQVFVRDNQSGKIQQVSVNSSGRPADRDSGVIWLQGEGFGSDVQISANGQWVAFTSQAANLLPDGAKKQTCTMLASDPYPCYDLFLHNVETGATTWVNQH